MKRSPVSRHRVSRVWINGTLSGCWLPRHSISFGCQEGRLRAVTSADHVIAASGLGTGWRNRTLRQGNQQSCHQPL